MKCPNPNCIPFPPELPNKTGINFLKGPCWKCGNYGNPETGELVKPEDIYFHNPRRYENTDEEEAESPYTGGW